MSRSAGAGRRLRPLKIMHRQWGFFPVVLACVVLSACAMQPMRVQQGAIPEAFPPSAKETAFGQRVFKALQKDYPLDADSPRAEQIQVIFEQLAESVDMDPGDWQVVLFDDPSVADVRAVDGNFIFVWSGVFDVIESEDELAGLLACEMAHELASHTDPVQFSAGSELLFGITDVATSLGVLLLTQGAVNISGTGMTRWAYVEAADLDPVDRVYATEQVEDMASIALMILSASVCSPEALLAFWKRTGSDAQSRQRVARLSRELPPQERLAIFETILPKLPVAQDPSPAASTVRTVDADEGKDS